MAFEIYKPGQGERVRGGLAVIAGALVAFGSYSLFQYLTGWSALGKNLTNAFGDDVPINWASMIGLVVFAVGAYLVFWLSNHEKVANFLIETEAELQKVTWSQRSEVITHSIVVIVTTIVLGVYIFALDQVLAKVFLDLVWG